MDNMNRFDVDDFVNIFRTDLMSIDVVGTIKKPAVKIEKTEDYYNFFVGMLNTEDMLLHNMEHLWVLGINDEGYSKCAHLVGYGHEITFDYDALQLLGTNIVNHCKRIVLAYHKNTTDKIEIVNQDVFFASSVYYRAALLGMELLDYIIISSAFHNLSQTPKRPNYASLKEADLMDIVAKGGLDVGKIESLKDFEVRNKEIFEEGEALGLERGKIEIARNMLAMNMSVEMIMQATGLSEAEIEEIKSEM